jgi:hypothetical protein
VYLNLIVRLKRIALCVLSRRQINIAGVLTAAAALVFVQVVCTDLEHPVCVFLSLSASQHPVCKAINAPVDK